jgi:hypothetical protein
MDQEPESIVDEFMGDNLRVSELRELQDALRARLDALLKERDAGGETRPVVDREIATARRHLAALQQEEIVSAFVESSVRATLARPAVADSDRDDDEL